MKNYRLALSLFYLPLAYAFAFEYACAADGTISFAGGVVVPSCVVTLNGSTASGSVTLPDVPTGALAVSGNTAGRTNFTLNLASCVTIAGKATVNTFFEAGPGVNPVTGNLINSGDATNVVIQILVASNSQQIIPGSPAQAQPKGVSLAAGSGVLNYAAQYYATGA